jgi:hypothetical protein
MLKKNYIKEAFKKALFKMYKCFEGHKPKIKTLLHVFDYTVKPILTYGSEVWVFIQSIRQKNVFTIRYTS